MSLIISLIVDSSEFSFSRPISFKIYKNNFYVLEITGNLWFLENLKSEPILLVKELNQPSYDIEIINDTIFIAHEGTISKFYKNKLEHIITNFPRYEINSTIKITKDTSNNLFIAVKDKVYKLKQNKLFLIASGFYEPIKIKSDKSGKIFIIAKIDEENAGIFPLYEGLNYNDIEPLIKFNHNEIPTSFIIQNEKIIVSFKDGKILEWSKFKDVFKSKILLDSNYEISDLQFYKNYIYFIDFLNGKIYKFKWMT
mgnify:CR=1 FL=1